MRSETRVATHQGHRRRWRAAGTLAVAAAMALSVVGTATAAPGKAEPNKPANAECSTGRSIPTSKISVQLWTFHSAIGEHGIEHVLAELSAMGYRNVEPYSYHGLSAEGFEELLDEYGLKAPSRHGPVTDGAFDQHLADARLFNQRYTGSGGWVGGADLSSLEGVLATAERMNEFGRRSVQNGTGPLVGHNHAPELENTFEVDGEEKTVWEILVENTDPRYVAFQLDAGWAAIGGADPVELLEEHGDRIVSLHVKDAVGLDTDSPTQVTVGEGEIDWPAVFDAAQGNVKLYIVEQDFPPDAFEMAAGSFEYLDCLNF
jgi:sugar phosphate isomerase/epimerase